MLTKQPRAGRSGVRIPAASRDFLFYKTIQTGYEAQRSFPGVMRSRSGVEDPPPSSAEVMNLWSCTSSPSVCLQGVDRSYFASYFLLSNVIPRCKELLEKLLVHQSVMNMTQPTIIISRVHSPSINFMSYLPKIIFLLSCYLSTFPKLCFQEITQFLSG